MRGLITVFQNREKCTNGILDYFYKPVIRFKIHSYVANIKCNKGIYRNHIFKIKKMIVKTITRLNLNIIRFFYQANPQFAHII